MTKISELYLTTLTVVLLAANSWGAEARKVQPAGKIARVESLVSQGQAHFKLKQYDQAAANFQEAVSIGHGPCGPRAEAHFMLFYMNYYELGRKSSFTYIDTGRFKIESTLLVEAEDYLGIAEDLLKWHSVRPEITEQMKAFQRDIAERQ